MIITASWPLKGSKMEKSKERESARTEVKMTAHYDLVVIGSGPAGEKGAAQVAYFGKKVALVERGPHLGGACINTGTAPRSGHCHTPPSQSDTEAAS